MNGTSQRQTGSQTTSHAAARGEVWLIDLTEPPRGREEGGKNRPALILSVDQFNQGPAELVIVIPLSAKDKGIRSHVRIDPPEGGVKYASFIKCEAIRSITTNRLIHRMGVVSGQTLNSVEGVVKVLIGIY